jgi:hypothetical protein
LQSAAARGDGAGGGRKRKGTQPGSEGKKREAIDAKCRGKGFPLPLL